MPGRPPPKINELNVFPVPDGDTGTNMSMTIGAATPAAASATAATAQVPIVSRGLATMASSRGHR